MRGITAQVCLAPLLAVPSMTLDRGYEKVSQELFMIIPHGVYP